LFGLVVTLILAGVSAENVVNGTFQILYTNNIPQDTRNITMAYTVVNTSAQFSVINCFGTMDWYFGLDFPPTLQNYTDRFPYNPENSFSEVFIPLESVPEVTVFLLFVCTQTYNGNDNCATFDFFINATGAPDLDSIIPVPANNGQVSGKVLDQGKSGSVTWEKTSNPNDTYDVYYNDGESAPDGYSYATACSVRLWMSNFTSDQGSVGDNGDGTITVTANGLSPKDPRAITVLAQRKGGYAASYDTYIIDGASMLVPSTLLLIVIAFIAF